jgi:hypothetical protein
VQLQTHVAGQNKPPGHFLLSPGGGHSLSQFHQNILAKAQFKKLLLVGLANDLDLVKDAEPELFKNPLGVVFD